MGTALREDEGRLVAALKAGDEAAFMALVEAWGPAMLRLARTHVASQAIAEEVVQDAWVGILRGLDRFEGRSSLKTWAFRIVANTAKTRGVREARSVPFSSADPRDGDDGPAVDPDRFLGPDHDRSPGHWARAPEPWPEDRLIQRETRDVALAAIDVLPPRQREIITLRDVEGFSADEARNALDLSETNQRVLLHRARSKVRRTLEEHFEFAAGAVLTLVDRDEFMTHPQFRCKLEAIGFGVFIPVFFVTSGLRFDLDALTGDPSNLVMVPIFLLALAAVRGLPAVLYRPLVGDRRAVAAGLLQATSLPFIVTATAIGADLGLIGGAESAELIAAGLLSVLLFPLAGSVLLRETTIERSELPCPTTPT